MQLPATNTLSPMTMLVLAHAGVFVSDGNAYENAAASGTFAIDTVVRTNISEIVGDLVLDRASVASTDASLTVEIVAAKAGADRRK